MNGLHGIIFAYEKAPGLRELTEARMPGSVPFGGRYRVVDFMLSNMAGAGITDVGVVLHGNYQSPVSYTHLRQACYNPKTAAAKNAALDILCQS